MPALIHLVLAAFVPFTVHWNAAAGNARSITIQVNHAPSIVVKRIPGEETQRLRINVRNGPNTLRVSAWTRPDGRGVQLGYVRIPHYATTQRITGLGVTFNGPCSRYIVGPLVDEPFVVPRVVEDGQTEFVLAGPDAKRLIATPADTDNNAILQIGHQSPIAASFENAQRAPSVRLRGMDEFEIRPIPVKHPRPLKLRITSAYCANVSRIAFVQFSELIYVAAGGTIRIFDGFGDPITIASAFSGVEDAQSIGFDPVNGHLYVVDLLGPIRVFAPSGAPVPTSGTFPGIHQPMYLAADSATGNIFVAHWNCAISPTCLAGAAIAPFSPEGYALPVTGAFPSTGCAYAVGFDLHNRHLYTIIGSDQRACEASGGNVQQFAQDGAPVPSPGGFPNTGTASGITFDAHNNRLYLSIRVYSGSGLRPVQAYDESGSPVALSGTFAELCCDGADPSGIGYDPTFDQLIVVSHLDGTHSGVFLYDEDGNSVSAPGGFPGVPADVLSTVAVVPP